VKNGEHDPQLGPRCDLGDLSEEGGRDVGEPLVGDAEEEPVLVAPAASICVKPSERLKFTQPVAGALIGKAAGLLDAAPGELPVGAYPHALGRVEAEGEVDQGQKAPKRRVAQVRHLREHRVRHGNAEEARRERLGGLQR
jgi:hypothetical protein